MTRRGAVSAQVFTRGCVASPHRLASEAGAAVLADGGNAVDAAVAANLALAVVTPYHCGLGGDLFALVWDGEVLHGYNGSGRAPAAATLEAMRAAAGADSMPRFGPLTVTVPGAVEAWFALVERLGSRPFGTLARAARRLAADGFVLSAEGASWFAAGPTAFGSAAGSTLRQPALARALVLLGEVGPDAFYGGEIGAGIAACVRGAGGLLDEADIATHRGEWVEPVRFGYHDVEVVELPPNSQGLTAQMAIGIAAAAGDGAPRDHLLIEAVKLALAERDAHLTDPAWMEVDPRSLIDPQRLAGLAAGIDPDRAHPVPRPGDTAGGGTAYLCAADANGMCVSLIQSNYTGFGSGLTVPEYGIGLQNRGAYFSLDPGHRNAIAPRKRTLHTLMPAMVLRGGRPWLVLGTMGADAQPSIQVQLIAALVDDGRDVAHAVDAPRWAVVPADGSVLAESRLGAIGELRARGHSVTEMGGYEHALGHAHAIMALDDGRYAAAADPRTEGAAR
jgi:gamma-glutamyltranspeptidase/glutathione hydrolase